MSIRRRLASALLVAALSGCRPPADPLDWKIDAGSPAELNAWIQEHEPLLPEALHAEFVDAYDRVIATLPPTTMAPRNLEDQNNPLCRHLNRRTIRSIVIEGYELEVTRLLTRIGTESDIVVSNAKRSEKLADPKALERFAKVRDAQIADLEKSKAHLAEVRARISVLTGGNGPSPKS